jgi:NTE family protein
MASHAGALRALHEIAGIDPSSARLIIGTSAGSVIGALLRTGHTPAEIWKVAARTEIPDDPLHDVGNADLFTRSWSNPAQLVRRSLGSAFVMTRSVARFPLVPMPLVARRLFPGGMLSVREEAVDVGGGIPEEWPDDPLWLCAVDIGTGKRVVLGSRDDRPPLREAVLASCAIPGYYQPVRFADRTLVDGGVHSATNLDLAARAEPDLVIALAPMGYDPQRSPGPIGRAVRRPLNRGIARHRLTLRAGGKSVVLLRPGREEVHAQGLNPMRQGDLESVATAAFDATARIVSRPAVRRQIEAASRPAELVADAS